MTPQKPFAKKNKKPRTQPLSEFSTLRPGLAPAPNQSPRAASSSPEQVSPAQASSIGPVPVPVRRHRAAVWDNFKKDPFDLKKAYCIHCTAVVKITKSETTGMHKHLVNHHDIDVKKLARVGAAKPRQVSAMFLFISLPVHLRSSQWRSLTSMILTHSRRRQFNYWVAGSWRHSSRHSRPHENMGKSSFNTFQEANSRCPVGTQS